MEETLKISEEMGKDLLQQAIDVAKEKFELGVLVSEHDFFAGAIIVLDAICRGNSEELPTFLAWPTIVLISGRPIVADKFDNTADKVNYEAHQNQVAAFSKLHNDVYEMLKAILDSKNISVAHEMARQLIEDIYQEAIYDSD
jgi:hypothetical protein